MSRNETAQKRLARTETIVEILRDNYGVPHIYANCVEGLYYAYGYVMAKDRHFQLEMFRRGNEGTVAEVFGSRYLERDQMMRRDGYSDCEITNMINSMDDFSQTVLRSFTKGIAKYVEEAKMDPENKLSKEFHDLQLEPKNWTETDVIRLFLSSQMVFMDQEQEIVNAGFLQKMIDQFGEKDAIAMFDDIFWINDTTSPPTILNSNDRSFINQIQKGHIGQQLPKGIVKVAEDILSRRARFEKHSQEISFPLSIGSYAVIIGPEKTKSGNPMVLGGPQAGFTAPGFLYEIGLHGPGIDILGSSFIGYPFIMFGTTNEVSFSSTAGYGNVVDIFIEELHPEDIFKYKYRNEWIDMEKQSELFFVKDKDGGLVEQQKEFFHTIHGPVIFIDEENKVAYSKAWTFRGTEAQTWSSNLKTNWTKDVDEFIAAARLGTLSLNRFVADKDGNIAYYHAGNYPVRDERVDQRFPTPGNGEFEWKGFFGNEENPFEKNPATHYFANWNNKPADHWHNGELCFNWGSDHRVRQYIDRLEAASGLTLEELDKINYKASLAVLRTKEFKPLLLNSLSMYFKEEKYEEIIDCLQSWDDLGEDIDGDGFYDSPALTIFEEWWSVIYDEVFKSKLGDLHPSLKRIIDHGYGCSLMLKIIRADKSLNYKWIHEDEIENLILTSFQMALQKLEEQYGTSDYQQWKTPIRKMSFGGSSIIGIPHGLGSHKQILEMNRGSENHYVELTPNGPIGFNITPPGHVGFIHKSGKVDVHYEDQLEMFERWDYKSMYLHRDEIEKNVVFTETVQFQRTVHEGGN